VLVTTNGSRLIGTVVNKQKDGLQFKTPFAGTVEIQWANVSELTADEPVRIMLADEQIISAHRLKRNQDQWEVSLSGEPVTTLKQGEVAYLNPAQWRTGEGWSFDGKVNFAVESERGNSDSDEIDIDGEITLRRGKNRFRGDAEFEKDKSFGVTTKSKWLTTGKIDHFSTKKSYWSGIGVFEHDKFADLDLRSILGVWKGYQFYEGPDFNLSFEAGPTFTNENYSEGSDNKYWGGGWHFKVDKFIFKRRLQPYHQHYGIANLEDTDKVIIKSWTGVRFPLKWGIVSSAEIKVEYDSEPVDQTDKTDTTYRLKLGYTW